MLFDQLVNLVSGYKLYFITRDKLEHYKTVKKLEKENIAYKTHAKASQKSIYQEKIYKAEESLTYIIDVKKKDYEQAKMILDVRHEDA